MHPMRIKLTKGTSTPQCLKMCGFMMAFWWLYDGFMMALWWFYVSKNLWLSGFLGFMMVLWWHSYTNVALWNCGVGSLTITRLHQSAWAEWLQRCFFWERWQFVGGIQTPGTIMFLYPMTSTSRTSLPLKIGTFGVHENKLKSGCWVNTPGVEEIIKLWGVEKNIVCISYCVYL